MVRITKIRNKNALARYLRHLADEILLGDIETLTLEEQIETSPIIAPSGFEIGRFRSAKSVNLGIKLSNGGLEI